MRKIRASLTSNYFHPMVSYALSLVTRVSLECHSRFAFASGRKTKLGRCGIDVGSMWGRCRIDVGSTWSWMKNMYNKMRRRRENNKIVEEGIKN